MRLSWRPQYCRSSADDELPTRPRSPARSGRLLAPYLVAAADRADDDPVGPHDDSVGPHAERGLRTRSRTDTSPLPSTFDGRASSDSTYGLAMRSSAASSMVTSRSPMDPEICEFICRMARELPLGVREDPRRASRARQPAEVRPELWSAASVPSYSSLSQSLMICELHIALAPCPPSTRGWSDSPARRGTLGLRDCPSGGIPYG